MLPREKHQGKRGNSPVGFFQHHSWGKNWLFAEDRPGIGSPPAWTGGGPREELLRGVIQNPPKHRQSCACLELERKLFPGPMGNRAGCSESQGLRFCHQAWQGRREAINDISQDGNNERCCLGPLAVLPPHRSAWQGRRTLLLSFTISPCFLLFPSLPSSLIFALLCLVCLPSFGYFPWHILPFLLALNAFSWLSPFQILCISPFPSLAFCRTLWKATRFELCFFHYPALAPGSNRLQLEQSIS